MEMEGYMDKIKISWSKSITPLCKIYPTSDFYKKNHLTPISHTHFSVWDMNFLNFTPLLAVPRLGYESYLTHICWVLSYSTLIIGEYLVLPHSAKYIPLVIFTKNSISHAHISISWAWDMNFWYGIWCQYGNETLLRLFHLMDHPTELLLSQWKFKYTGSWKL